MTDAKSLLDFFFEASLATYAGGGEKSAIAGLPGAKSLRFERCPFLYVDTYFVNGTQSCGQTLIWCDGAPVWVMQYRGFCTDKEAINILKRALSDAYRMKRFHGGRGETQNGFATIGTYRYHNWPLKNDFASFEGKEFIDRHDRVRHQTAADPVFWTERVFMHEYNGGLLTLP